MWSPSSLIWAGFLLGSDLPAATGSEDRFDPSENDQPQSFVTESCESPPKDENTTIGGPSLDEQECLIQLDNANSVRGTLPGGKKMDLIVDSGASISVISSVFVDSCQYLRELPREPTRPMRIKIANGSYVESTEKLRFQVHIQGYVFYITARILPTVGLVSCLLGTPDLKELRATLDFEANLLRFKIPTDAPFRIKNSLALPPHSTRTIQLVGHLPRAARSGEVIIQSSKLGRRVSADCFLANVTRGECTIVVHNPTSSSI